MKGWAPKSSVCPSKPRESNFFGGISRDIPEAPEKFEKKMFGFHSRPLNLREKESDPRVPLQKAKLENRENDIFGQKMPFAG